MKKILFYIVLLCAFLSAHTQTQTLKYTDEVLLFSKENSNGTARFNAMSGAFGALGGDLSSTNVNPAGLTVFKDSQSTLSLNYDNFSTESNFYGTLNNSDNNAFNLNQAGAVLVFDNNNDYWNKFSLAINYTLKNEFKNNIYIQGNSLVSEFENDPYLNFDNDSTNDIFYTNTDSQKINDISKGSNSRTTISFAAKYDKKTSFGISLISHNLDYTQFIVFNELSNDGASNSIDAESNQRLYTNGTGIGFNIGILHKATKNIRLGLSYQSPIWYDLTEEYYEDNSIFVSNNTNEYVESLDPSYFEYTIQSPSNITASFAYVFNKQGLISLDYYYKNYKNSKLRPNNEFDTENNFIKSNFNNTNNLNIGGEYRLEKLSLRAGYSFSENPNKNITNDNYGYSLGLGVKVNDYTSIDFAYQKQENFYNTSYFNDESFTTNKLDSNKFTVTLSVGL